MPRRSGGPFALNSGGKTKLKDALTSTLALSNLPVLGSVCRLRPSIHRKLERRNLRSHQRDSPIPWGLFLVRPPHSSPCSCSHDPPLSHPPPSLPLLHPT